jgi:hypothetical protein
MYGTEDLLFALRKIVMPLDGFLLNSLLVLVSVRVRVNFSRCEQGCRHSSPLEGNGAA